jgi:soluble lytic murein transglycosylase
MAGGSKRFLPVLVIVAVGPAAFMPVVPTERAPAEPVAVAAETPAVEPYDPTIMAGYLTAAAATDRARAVAELRRGLALSKDGKPGALEAFARAAELAPGMADWSRAFAAEAAARSGDTAEVRRQFEATEPWLASEWGWWIRVRGLRAARNFDGALAEAQAVIDRSGSAARRSSAWRSLGETNLLRGDTAAARIAYRRAIDEGLTGEAAFDAAWRLSQLRGSTAEDHLRVARLYLRGGNLPRGLEAVDRYLASGRTAAVERAELQLAAGRALFGARRYTEAERRLAAVQGTGVPRDMAAEAELLLGRSQFRQNKEPAARSTFIRLAEHFPEQPAAAEGLFILADLEHDAGRLSSAREYYRRALSGASVDSDAAALSAMRLAGMAYLQGDFGVGVQVFEEYRSQSPSGRRAQKASYWLARSHLQLGQREQATALLQEVLAADPASYYGMRAADMLGGLPWQHALLPSPRTDAATTAEVAGALIRLDILAELGQTDAGSFEMERLRRHFADRPAALYTVAESYIERGQIFAGIRLGRELQREAGAWNARLLRIVYPFPHQQLIEAESRKRGIDPYLVAGLIRQESMFNANAVSGAGAVGLMQVMPATGRALARRAGIRNFDVNRLKGPDLNVQLGTMFFADLLNQYDGRLVDVLAAYNAGPGRLARWRSLEEYRESELFAERIPYAETRDYVKVVQQNARIYAAIYGPGSDALSGLGD